MIGNNARRDNVHGDAFSFAKEFDPQDCTQVLGLQCKRVPDVWYQWSFAPSEVTVSTPEKTMLWGKSAFCLGSFPLYDMH